jgi:hypothetical protein
VVEKQVGLLLLLRSKFFSIDLLNHKETHPHLSQQKSKVNHGTI